MSVKKFRKIPVVIDAIQWTGNNEIQIMDFVGKKLEYGKIPSAVERELDNIPASVYWIAIPTLEGTMKASLNDWIIKGVAGEFYPCKPEIFENTYEIA